MLDRLQRLHRATMRSKVVRQIFGACFAIEVLNAGVSFVLWDAHWFSRLGEWKNEQRFFVFALCIILAFIGALIATPSKRV